MLWADQTYPERYPVKTRGSARHCLLHGQSGSCLVPEVDGGGGDITAPANSHTSRLHVYDMFRLN